MVDLPEFATAESVRITDGTSVIFTGTNAGTVSISGIVNTRFDGVSYTTIRRSFEFTTSASTVIWAPSTGKRWNITDIIISTTSSCTVTLLDGTSTIVRLYLAANGGMVSNFTTPLSSAGTNTNLNINTTASTTFITLLGYESD